MKPAARFEGVVHDRVECPETGSLFDVSVIGADADDRTNTISLRASGLGVDLGLRLSRDQARRIGELLIQAADDGMCARCHGELDAEFFPDGGEHDVCPAVRS